MFESLLQTQHSDWLQRNTVAQPIKWSLSPAILATLDNGHWQMLRANRLIQSTIDNSPGSRTDSKNSPAHRALRVARVNGCARPANRTCMWNRLAPLPQFAATLANHLTSSWSKQPWRAGNLVGWGWGGLIVSHINLTHTLTIPTRVSSVAAGRAWKPGLQGPADHSC